MDKNIVINRTEEEIEINIGELLLMLLHRMWLIVLETVSKDLGLCAE